MTPIFRHSSATIRPLILALIALNVLLVVGCSRVSQEAEAPDLQIELVEPLFPSAVGKETLTIRVFDAANQPIDNATINVRGDMTHAGMVPILAETENGDKGLYQVLVEWTMGGDWIITVQATLPDGTVAEKTFPRTIAHDAADCLPEDQTTP